MPYQELTDEAIEELGRTVLLGLFRDHAGRTSVEGMRDLYDRSDEDVRRLMCRIQGRLTVDFITRAAVTQP